MKKHCARKQNSSPVRSNSGYMTILHLNWKSSLLFPLALFFFLIKQKSPFLECSVVLDNLFICFFFCYYMYGIYLDFCFSFQEADINLMYDCFYLYLNTVSARILPLGDWPPSNQCTCKEGFCFSFFVSSVYMWGDETLKS